MPDDHTAIIQAALQEVQDPIDINTRSFFSVHRLADDDPVVHVEMEDEGDWLVYFRLHDESYHWVQRIGVRDSRLEPRGGWHMEHAWLYLRITGDTVSPDVITETLGVAPTSSQTKGDLWGRANRPYGFHAWNLNPSCPDCYGFEQKLQTLLADLQPLREKLLSLSQDCNIGISCAFYEYACRSSGWHLDRQTIQQLADLNLYLDIDLYAGGPEEPD